MTSEDWLHVGSRLLGIYFVVLGALTGTNALAIVGMGLPEGTHRAAVVVAPLIQALISVGAGVWLLNRSVVRGDPDQAAISDPAPVFRRAIQLLGLVFLIDGASELGKTIIDSYLVGAEWQIRAASVASGLVNAVAGALLVFMPAKIVRTLDDVRR
jgi:hypothetical protein